MVGTKIQWRYFSWLLNFPCNATSRHRATNKRYTIKPWTVQGEFLLALATSSPGLTGRKRGGGVDGAARTSSQNFPPPKTGMALIVRDELMSQCVSAGRDLQYIVRQQLESGDDKLLSKAKLEKVFAPVVKYVERYTEEKVRREIDETTELMKRKKQRDAMEVKIASLKRSLDNTTVVRINGKPPQAIRNQMSAAKRLKKVVEEKLVPEFESASVVELEPEIPLEELDPNAGNPDWYWASCWDKYVPALEIKVDAPANKLLKDRDLYNFGKYLRSKKLTRRFTIAEIIERLQRNNNTFSVDKENMERLVEVLKKIDSLLLHDIITRVQMLNFVREINTLDRTDQFIVMSALEHVRKSYPRCGAEDCDNVVKEQDPDVCEICDTKLCGSCISDRCAEHGERCAACDDNFVELDNGTISFYCTKTDCAGRICVKCNIDGLKLCNKHQ